ncbi:MAG: TAXI family TRAP transporter solute-binding subunit [Desulfobacterales bacterium]
MNVAKLMSFIAVWSAAAIMLHIPAETPAATRFITIGTGGVTGIYYPTGGAIAKMVNRQRDLYGIRCTVESTAGSVFNVNAVASGDLDFGIVQSDRQYQAVNGIAEWEKLGPRRNLRAVFSIHPETVTLCASAESNIITIQDLRGKRVNIGNPGSGHRQNAIDALTASGIDWKTGIHAEQVKAAEAPGLLQDGRIDAFFYTVGHPSGAIKEATAGTTRVRFVAITGIDQLLRQYPYYTRSMVPIDDYPGAINEADVPTFGVKATLVTSAGVSDDAVYAVTKEVFSNLENFKELHPAYAVLNRENMLEGLTAPIHPGAMKYYREVGLK